MSEIVSDDKLVKLIASGDPSAFKDIYRKHYNMVKHLVEQNSGSADDASDIFQETMIVLYEKTCNGNLNLTSSLKTFIYSIARNQWFRKLRDRKKLTRLNDFEEFIAEEEKEEVSDFDTEKLKMIFNEIGDSCKQLLILFYYRKLSMQQICAQLGYSNSDTVKTQKYKCLQRIKKMIVI